MPRVLITAFEPYGQWDQNSSWLALVELTKELPESCEITTRLYPVDFAAVSQKLQEDLAQNFDFALHLGQAPGSTCIQLEAFGLNIGGTSSQRLEDFRSLVDGGPVAYQSTLPLARWARSLREKSIPAAVSHHAGTYLCNATLYLTHHLAAERQLRTQATFVHLPLAPCQVLDSPRLASLATATSASGVRMIVEDLAD